MRRNRKRAVYLRFAHVHRESVDVTFASPSILVHLERCGDVNEVHAMSSSMSSMRSWCVEDNMRYHRFAGKIRRRFISRVFTQIPIDLLAVNKLEWSATYRLHHMCEECVSKKRSDGKASDYKSFLNVLSTAISNFWYRHLYLADSIKISRCLDSQSSKCLRDIRKPWSIVHKNENDLIICLSYFLLNSLLSDYFCWKSYLIFNIMNYLLQSFR